MISLKKNQNHSKITKNNTKFMLNLNDFKIFMIELHKYCPDNGQR